MSDSCARIEFVILTLFPRYFDSPFSESILAKAREKGIVEVKVVDLREFAEGRHRVADDYPFGGGEGMVLKLEPIVRALEKACAGSHPGGKRVLLSPQGLRFTQKLARELAREERIVLICGHYEGVDERVAENCADLQISIGDYILSGGEAAALVVVETVARLIPEVLGNPDSSNQDSFSRGLLKHPVYTRPRQFRGWEVPAVLLSGDHEKIGRWQRKEALRRTRDRRPDLWEGIGLDELDQELLAELEEDEEAGGKNEYDGKN